MKKIEDMSEEEFNQEIEKGYKSYLNNEGIPIDVAMKMIQKKGKQNTIWMKTFGEVLLSRDDAKKDFSKAKKLFLGDVDEMSILYLDFSGIKVITPGYLDEFITMIKNDFKNNLEYLNTDNESVSMSLKTVLA